MEFSIQREVLLKPLQSVISIVERRQTMPILGHVLLRVKGQECWMTTTDTEIELITRITLTKKAAQDGEITVSARKFIDICRSLPDESEIHCILESGRFIIRSGKKRFVLATLPSSQFPNTELDIGKNKFEVPQKAFVDLLHRTAFAMAQQDVRLFLNGMLLEVTSQDMKTVATDGHRLALSTYPWKREDAFKPIKLIIPRKAVLELMRLLSDVDAPITIIFGTHHLRAIFTDMTFTSKLLEGHYPDYHRVIPAASEQNNMKVDRDELKQALSCAAILSNEQFKGVKLGFHKHQLDISTNNPAQEEAQDEMKVDYEGEHMVVGFNVNYLIDVLSALNPGTVSISLGDANSSALIQSTSDPNHVYVVMPIRI